MARDADQLQRAVRGRNFVCDWCGECFNGEARPCPGCGRGVHWAAPFMTPAEQRAYVPLTSRASARRNRERRRGT